MVLARLTVAFCAYALWAGSACAQLAISRLWLDFDTPSQRRGDLVLLNESDDRYYVTVDTFEIINPGTEEEERVTYADPSDLGLLVTPNRLILDPGQSRSLRVVRIDEDAMSDRTYRIRVEPQVGEISADGLQQERSMVIKLLAAYEVLVTARPDDLRFNLETSRTSDAISIKNAGTSSVVLFDLEMCLRAEAGSKAACEAVGSRRLYPGNSWSIQLAEPSAVLQGMLRTRLGETPRPISY